MVSDIILKKFDLENEPGLTHLLKLSMSFLDWTSLGRRAALWGTLMTPMYLLEFLGDRSRLMSIKGVPLTLRSSWGQCHKAFFSFVIDSRTK
jgi:hypothetical protein